MEKDSRMDDFQKELLIEIRELRRDLHDEIQETRTEFRDEMRLMWAAQNKTSDGLNLFKGKALGFLAVLTVVVNYGMSYFTKK